MTAAKPPRDDSIIDSLRGFVWSSEEAVSYEAAIEAINGAIGAYTARIAAEEAKPTSDAAALAAWREARADCTRRREELEPTNFDQIAEARRQFSALAEKIRSGRA